MACLLLVNSMFKSPLCAHGHCLQWLNNDPKWCASLPLLVPELFVPLQIPWWPPQQPPRSRRLHPHVTIIWFDVVQEPCGVFNRPLAKRICFVPKLGVCSWSFWRNWNLRECTYTAVYFNQNATFGTAPVCGTFLEKQAPDLEVPSLSRGQT